MRLRRRAAHLEGEFDSYEDEDDDTTEFEIATTVRDKLIYSEEVQKDDLLSHMIRVLGIYDKPYMIRMVTQSVSHFTEMIRHPSRPLVDTLYPDEGKLFPPYLIPIISDELKIYNEGQIQQELKDEALARESGLHTYQESITSESTYTNPFLVTEGPGYTTTDYSGRI